MICREAGRRAGTQLCKAGPAHRTGGACRGSAGPCLIPNQQGSWQQHTAEQHKLGATAKQHACRATHHRDAGACRVIDAPVELRRGRDSEAGRTVCACKASNNATAAGVRAWWRRDQERAHI